MRIIAWFRSLFRKPDGPTILRHAAEYLVRTNNTPFYIAPDASPDYYFIADGHTDVVSEAARPLFDALYILMCLAVERDRSLVNVSETVAWLLDEADTKIAESAHVG